MDKFQKILINEENSINFYKEKTNKIFLEDVIPNF